MMKNNPTLTIGCLLKDAIPIDIKKITWKDVDNSKAKQLPPINTSVIRAVSSFLTISSTDWDKNKYTCSVGDNKKELNEDCKRTSVTVTHPHTEVLLATCEDYSQLSIVPVTCLVSDFKPNEASVLWLKNVVRHDATNSGFKAWKGEDGLFSGKSTLNISRESWIKDDRYTCMVTLKGQTSMHNISKCSVCPGSFVTPVVDLQLPCKEDLLYNNGTIICSILGSNLDANQIFLKLDGKTARIDTTGNENSRTVSYKVATKVWDSTDKVSCGMKQPCYKQDVVKEIHVDHIAIETNSPDIQIMAPSCEDNTEASDLSLVCIISNFWPRDASVAWLMNGERVVNSGKDFSPMLTKEGTYFGKSVLNVNKQSWNKEDTYICQVTHQHKSYSQSISRCSDPQESSIAIKVFAIPPTFESMFKTKTATLTCLVTNMVSPKGLNISWYEEGSSEHLNTFAHIEEYQEKNNTFSAKRIATVCADDWNKKKFVCKVKHPALAFINDVTLSKDNGKSPQAPSIYIFPPHQDEVGRRETVTLTCLVRGFYPKDIFITWLQGDEEMQMEKHIITQPMEEISSNGMKTYLVYSILTLPSIENWTSGESYSCVVGHESLPLQVIQKSVNKFTVKPTSVNVSLTLSDTC